MTSRRDDLFAAAQSGPGPAFGIGCRHRALAALGAVALVATTACALPSAAAPPGSTAPRTYDVPPPPPAVWTACGDGLDCATVAVPVDYADPGGATVPLALVRRPAGDPAQRIGSLLVNPGGPGGPAEMMVRMVDATGAPVFFSSAVADRFDVVAMDPRGVGESAAIRCLSDEQREVGLALDVDPPLPGGVPRAEAERMIDEFTAGCAAGVDPALLANMSTEEVARDMDQVRAALGEERISYLGLSYGTLLGATYATLFPERVDRMVLDAPVDPRTWQQDPLGATVDQAAGAESLLNRYFALCAAEGTACPFGNGRPVEAFDALVQRLEAEPLPVPAANGLPPGRVDGATVVAAARFSMFAHESWPVLTAGLVAAEDGDGTLLHLIATANGLLREEDGTPSGLAEANVAVNCLDRAVPADLAAHERNAAELAERAPRFGPGTAYLWLTCTQWPAANDDRFTGPLDAAGAGPILVVGGREDSQTPYHWAESMAATLESATLLTRDGVGHGSYRVAGPCVDDAVDRHLVEDVLPAAGTACPQAPAPTTDPAAVDG